MELLRSEALEGERAVIIVTHDNRMFGFADRIAQMEDGRVVEVHRQQVRPRPRPDFQETFQFCATADAGRAFAEYLPAKGCPSCSPAFCCPLVAVGLLIYSVVHMLNSDPLDAGRAARRSSRRTIPTPTPWPGRAWSKPRPKTSRSARRCRAWWSKCSPRSA